MSELVSQFASLTADQEMQQLGISTEFELKRFHNVQMLAGTEIAMREIHRNIEAYEREFLQDEPVGIPHDYYHINGELYSEAIDHSLFNIKKQIDPRERNGATLKGFEAFEELVTATDSEDNVVVWYSPAGKAGTEGPFKDIYFDAGRLYLCFQNGETQSVHIDIKINEDTFPIKEFLDHINSVMHGTQSPPDLSVNQAGHYYLGLPMSTYMSADEFLSFFHNFAQTHDTEVYVSQRESHSPKFHMLTDISAEVTTFLSNHAARQTQERVQKNNSINMSYLTRDQISSLYFQRIQPYLDQNNGQITLYGCSTTSTISQANMAGSWVSMEASVGSILSPYSSIGRMLGEDNLFQENKKYKYDKRGTCQMCERSHIEVGKLGPCYVCKGCTEDDNRKKRMKG